MSFAAAVALLLKAKGTMRMERSSGPTGLFATRSIVLGGAGKPYLLCDQKGMAALMWTDDAVADDWVVVPNT